jgi:cellulose synthase/poly-beta-1,6-N-acetylglucosamine synthase-like glycosyltransferase
VIAVVALGLTAQALFALYLMLYTWERPERLRASAGPTRFRAPGLSFTALLPARQEEAVIAETIRKVWSANYPKELLEIIVICQADDVGTISAGMEAIRAVGSPAVRMEVYSAEPYNKPHALNVGFAASSHETVTIFDAEDDIHPDIFNVVNTVMLDEQVGVVQAGVQLMNFRDHWFSIFNCLEYFFYYKSRLHFYANVGMIPLGGNTVFFRRSLVDKVGGWDITSLTEDCDIGIRLSAAGEEIRVVYDSHWVTREETPRNVPALVRQRTRWHQGFLQTLQKRDWCRLQGGRRRALAVITLGQPLLDACLLCSVPAVPVAMIFFKIPVLFAMLLYFPLYGVLLQMLANMTAAVVFTREFGEKLPLRVLARMPFTYLPYQWLIGFSALRATRRQLAGRRDWEKTEHLGAHRVDVHAVRRVPLPEHAPANGRRSIEQPAWVKEMSANGSRASERPTRIAEATPLRPRQPRTGDRHARQAGAPRRHRNDHSHDDELEG